MNTLHFNIKHKLSAGDFHNQDSYMRHKVPISVLFFIRSLAKHNIYIYKSIIRIYRVGPKLAHIS